MASLSTDTARQDSIPKVKMKYTLAETYLILHKIHTSGHREEERVVFMAGWAMLHEHVVRHNVLFIISATQCIYPEDFSFCLKLKCFNRAYVFPICYFKSFPTICKYQ